MIHMTANTAVSSERSALLWGFLGPLFALSSATLLYVKEVEDFHFILLATLIGLSLTWVFRLKGLIISLALLVAFSLTLKGDVPLLWTLGALASMALAFLLTYLTLDDAEEKVLRWQKNLTMRETEVKTADTKVISLEKELEQAKKEYTSLEQVQELTRIELLSALAEQETLKEEITKLSHAKRKLEEEFEDQTFRLEGKRKLIEKLQNESALNQEMAEHIETLTREKDLLESTLSRLQAELEEKSAIPQVQQVEAPPATEPEYRRLFGLYKQLREQFTEKTALLDQTRRELFLANEKVALFEKEMSEIHLHEQPHVERLAVQLEDAQKEVAHLEELVSNLLQERQVALKE